MPGSDPKNLAADLSTFIGREVELAQLQELGSTTRLLTLVGPGGVGKSRLAVRHSASVQRDYSADVWLVDLASLADPGLVPRAVAEALGIRQRTGQDWYLTIIDRLRARQLLLLLDNGERVIAGGADLATRLLRACPGLRILATSREPLGVEGELVWRVPPLAVPDSNTNDVEHVAASEAVRLFVARVTARMSDFALTDENVATTAHICRYLGGLPLALEVVAARVPGVGLSQIAARLDSGYALGLSGGHHAPPRQRTLRATMDWSYRLLSQAEQVLLRRMAVFVGGWTLAAAEAVGSYDDLPAEQLADMLAQLVTRSLVQAEQQADETVRYRFLATIREYALEQLQASGEAARLERRHALYLLSLAERAAPEASDAGHARLVEQDVDNLRAALAWAIREGESDVGLRLAISAVGLWYFGGLYAEGSSWLEQLLAIAPADTTPASLEALTWAGQLLLLQGKYADAKARLQPVLDAQRARGDERGTALALLMLGNAALWCGDLLSARGMHAEAAERLRNIGNPAELVSVFQAAVVACELGELDQAREFAARCEALGRAGPRPVALAAALHLRALLAAREGDAAAALLVIGEALDLERRVADQQRLVETLTEQGHVMLELGRISEALPAFSEAVQLAMASGERICLVRALEGVAGALRESRPETTVRLAAATTRLREELGATRWPHDAAVLDATLAVARDSLTASASADAWDAGRALTEVEAASLALLPTPSGESERAAARQSGTSLTRREREVVELLARGLSTRQIARQLVISPDTVRTHLDHIMAKFDVHSRIQLVAWVTSGDGDGLDIRLASRRPPEATAR
jgi:predicted ATPase/DNA-binding CsgD family transcriptional regulator